MRPTWSVNLFIINILGADRQGNFHVPIRERTREGKTLPPFTTRFPLGNRAESGAGIEFQDSVSRVEQRSRLEVRWALSG